MIRIDLQVHLSEIWMKSSQYAKSAPDSRYPWFGRFCCARLKFIVGPGRRYKQSVSKQCHSYRQVYQWQWQWNLVVVDDDVDDDDERWDDFDVNVRHFVNSLLAPKSKQAIWQCQLGITSVVGGFQILVNLKTFSWSLLILKFKACTLDDLDSSADWGWDSDEKTDAKLHEKLELRETIWKTRQPWTFCERPPIWNENASQLHIYNFGLWTDL